MNQICCSGKCFDMLAMHTENCMFHNDRPPAKLCIIGNSIANSQPVFIMTSGLVLSGSELLSFVLQYLPSHSKTRSTVTLYGSIAIVNFIKAKLDDRNTAMHIPVRLCNFVNATIKPLLYCSRLHYT